VPTGVTTSKNIALKATLMSNPINLFSISIQLKFALPICGFYELWLARFI
jgi:hypothetical protein